MSSSATRLSLSLSQLTWIHQYESIEQCNVTVSPAKMTRLHAQIEDLQHHRTQCLDGLDEISVHVSGEVRCQHQLVFGIEQREPTDENRLEST